MRRLVMLAFAAVTMVGLLAAPISAAAHETRPAVLELRETAPERFDVLWRTPLYEGQRLPFVLGLPNGVRQVSPPIVISLPDWHLESWRIVAPGGLVGKRILFSGHDATTAGVVVRYSGLDGRQSSVVVSPDKDGLTLAGEGSAGADFTDAVALGLRHIGYGIDHLLFVLGLVCLARGGWRLVETVTAFTVAHSLTLAAAALGLVSLRAEPVNAVVALSILFLGPEMVRQLRGQASLAIRRPAAVAFAFGLLHGLGFAGGLSGFGLSREALVATLLGFNLGVEIGQLAFVAALLAVAASLARLGVSWPAWAGCAPAYVVGTAGAYLAIARTAVMLGA